MKKDNLNKNSFKTPENYFDSLHEKILSNVDKKNNFFDVPKNYFDELENTILQKERQRELKGKQKKLFHFNYWLAAACVIVFILLSAELLLINKQKVEKQPISAKVEKEVYEKIYDSFLTEDNHNIKSSNITLDDSDYAIYYYY